MSILNVPNDRQQTPLLWVKLLRLDLQAVIGIFPEERTTPQALSLEVRFAVSSADWVIAATTGNLKRSLDYSKVFKSIEKLVIEGRFRLLESIYYILAYMFLRLPHESEERVNLAALEIKLVKMNALSSTGSPHPVLEGSLTHDQWLNLETSLEPFIPYHTSMLMSLGLITGSSEIKIEGRKVLELPELTLYHLTSDHAGSLRVQDEDSSLIMMSTSSSTDHHDNRISYRWEGGLSALYIKATNANFDHVSV